MADYLQNDCKLTERDKISSGRQTYLNFDTTSFENPLFKKLSEGELSLTGAQPYHIDSIQDAQVNRFNVDLLKETVPNLKLGSEDTFKVGMSASGAQ